MNVGMTYARPVSTSIVIRCHVLLITYGRDRFAMLFVQSVLGVCLGGELSGQEVIAGLSIVLQKLENILSVKAADELEKEILLDVLITILSVDLKEGLLDLIHGAFGQRVDS